MTVERFGEFLSTPSGWRATSSALSIRAEDLRISIHALRVEGDAGRKRNGGADRISIHALRVEGDRGHLMSSNRGDRFLSTPSGWRATAGRVGNSPPAMHFYPRPPGGGRPLKSQYYGLFKNISIHALRVEGDVCKIIRRKQLFKFLSTPSGWRATSTHTALEIALMNFYPRPPGGGRQVHIQH